MKRLGTLDTQTKSEMVPMNTFINGIINMDSKGVSKLYTSLNSGKDSILIDIMNKWKEMTGKRFIHDKVDKTFIINHQSNVNMIIRLIQFRFL